MHLNPAELEALLHPAGPFTGAGEADVSKAQNHVAGCRECQFLLERHAGQELRLAQLKTRSGAPRSSACPPETEWLDVAGGLTAGRKVETLLDHAAVCDHCGLLLRRSLADFAEEVTGEEEQFLAGLESVRPQWQEQMAARAASETRRPAKRRALLSRILLWLRRPLFAAAPVPRWAFGSIAVMLTTLVVILQSPGAAPVEQLLATAYTSQRTLQVLIPQAAYGPLRLVRGSTAPSRLDRPPALLEAEATIAREIAAKPNDPQWLHARGRAELLDRDYDAAIADLQRCLTVQPTSPVAIVDLACAHFERAQAKNAQQDYQAALDLLTRRLQSSPDDLVALFNRAIVYQTMHRHDQAREDWRHYLRVDPDSQWAAEARQRLAEIR